MGTLQGESSQDIRSLNEINFSFIVLGCCYYLVWRGMLIPNFVVSTTILNPVDISCRWYKLNFGLLQGQVKLYHFYEWIEAKRQFFFLLFVRISWNNWLEATLDNHLDDLLIWIHYYLLNGTGWDKTYLTLLLATLTFVF